MPAAEGRRPRCPRRSAPGAGLESPGTTARCRPRPCAGRVSDTLSSRPGSSTGSGVRTAKLRIAKITEQAPMPRAEDPTAIAAKSRGAAHRAHRVAKVLQERVERRRSPDGADVFADQRPVSERPCGGGVRVLRRQPVVAPLFCLELEVHADFTLDVLFALVPRQPPRPEPVKAPLACHVSSSRLHSANPSRLSLGRRLIIGRTRPEERVEKCGLAESLITAALIRW